MFENIGITDFDYGNGIAFTGDLVSTTNIPKSISIKPGKVIVSTPKIKRVHFSNNMTIIIWEDGKKTYAKPHGKDKFDKEKGFLIAYAKRFVAPTKLKKEMERWCCEQA